MQESFNNKEYNNAKYKVKLKLFNKFPEKYDIPNTNTIEINAKKFSKVKLFNLLFNNLYKYNAINTK